MRHVLLALCLLCLGCDDLAAVQADTFDACAALLTECDETLVPPLSYPYCMTVAAMTNDAATMDNLYVHCDLFRRGQVCTCLTPVCYELLLLGPGDNLWTQEATDAMDLAQDLACPRADLYAD